ncbi:MAG: hypothetical protein ACOH19_09135 [Rhodoglobus sp.]
MLSRTSRDVSACHFSAAPRTAIAWMPVSGVQQLVYVAKVDGKPVAILQMRPGSGFDLTDCVTGEFIGNYASLIQGQEALTGRLAGAAR